MANCGPKPWENILNKISPVDELFKAALYTLLRPAEYCVLEWNWIDFYSKTITIPAPYLKEKREFTLPISRHFLRILCQRHSVFVRYVIACANKGKNPSPVSFKKFLKKPRSRWGFPSDQKYKDVPADSVMLNLFFQRNHLNKIIELQDLWDLGYLWMIQHGIRREIAARCLSKGSGVVTTDSKLHSDLFKECREAMEEWGGYVYECINRNNPYFDPDEDPDEAILDPEPEEIIGEYEKYFSLVFGNPMISSFLYR